MTSPRFVFNRALMLGAMHRLAEKLHERKIEGRLYVVGGAAMTLAYRADRLTRDIDGIVSPPEIVFDVAGEVAAELDLPADWLSSAAVRFMPEGTVGDGVVVLDEPGLQVRAAPAEVVLAMKLFAGRPRLDGKDIADLCGIAGIESVEAARALYLRYYPDREDRFGRSTPILEELFDATS